VELKPVELVGPVELVEAVGRRIFCPSRSKLAPAVTTNCPSRKPPASEIWTITPLSRKPPSAIWTDTERTVNVASSTTQTFGSEVLECRADNGTRTPGLAGSSKLTVALAPSGSRSADFAGTGSILIE
jgi:hypothetical protein